MRTFSKIGIGVGLLGVALLIGGGVGLFVTRQDTGGSLPTNAPAPSAIASTTAKAAPVVPATNTALESSDLMEAPPAEPSGWEQQLDDILVKDADEATKASDILAIFPNAPDEGKIELAQHLVNLVQDDNYSGVAELLTNSSTLPAVSTVLMNDLLNRNNNLKLPMLLAIARTDDHPLKSDAKDMLELFIQDDKGTNWDEWETAVNKWLQENENQDQDMQQPMPDPNK